MHEPSSHAIFMAPHSLCPVIKEGLLFEPFSTEVYVGILQLVINDDYNISSLRSFSHLFFQFSFSFLVLFVVKQPRKISINMCGAFSYYQIRAVSNFVIYTSIRNPILRYLVCCV